MPATFRSASPVGWKRATRSPFGLILRIPEAPKSSLWRYTLPSLSQVSGVPNDVAVSDAEVTVSTGTRCPAGKTFACLAGFVLDFPETDVDCAETANGNPRA